MDSERRHTEAPISRRGLLLVLLCILSSCIPDRVTAEYRTLDGSGNNLKNPTWGQANTRQIRFPKSSYADSKDKVDLSLPNPRNISNALFGIASKRVLSSDGNSDVTTFWGQFLDHDIVKTPSDKSEYLPIQVPTCDPWFDHGCTGKVAMPFFRSSFVHDSDGVRNQINQITAFIDASQIYGSDDQWALKLRTMQGGKMKTSSKNLMPLDNLLLPMDNPVQRDPRTLFLAGDTRANENPALSSLHVLFLREHNRLCDQFSLANPSWDDEKLYQEARKYVGAYMQVIFDLEYVPAILGQPLPTYTGYKADVNPSINSFFSTAAFRYGHSEVNSVINRIGSEGQTSVFGPIVLRDGFFNPTHVQMSDIDSILRGISQQYQQKIDTQFVDDIRNFLFGTPEHGGLDLAATNIWRGRDHGILLYNDAREQYGLKRYTSFSEITSDKDIVDLMEAVYGSVDRVDSYVGGLAEDPHPPSILGELFTAAVTDQYARLRDGDRFWYQNVFSGSELNDLMNTRLSDIIVRNTQIRRTEIQKNVFAVSPPVSTNDEKPDYYVDATGATRKLTFDVSSTDYFSTTLLKGEYELYWKIVEDTFVEIALRVKTKGWVGFGINVSGGEMRNADMIIGWVSGSQKVVSDYYSRAFVEPRTDVSLGGTDDIIAAIAQEANGYTFIKCVRHLNSTDKNDWSIPKKSIQFLAAFGDDDSFGQHARDARMHGTIDFYSGAVSSSSDTILYIHAILAGFVYSMNSAIVVFIARYMRRSIRMWKEIHVVMQIIAFLAAFTAAGLLFYRYGDRIVTAHALFGLLTLLLTVFQAFRGVSMRSRKRDNYFSSDRTHKWNGLFTTIMQFVTVYLGLRLLKPAAAYFYFYYAFTAVFWSASIYREYEKKKRLNRAVRHATKSRSNFVS